MLKNYITKFYNNEYKSFLKENKFTKKNSNFFSFSQKAVTGSIAIGLFCGLLPAPFQMVSAGTLAYCFQINIPIAIFTTLYSNPITVIPLYLICLKVGIIFLNFFSKISSLSFLNITQRPNNDIHDLLKEIPKFQSEKPIKFSLELLEWLLSIGFPLLIGTLIFAISLSLVGYIAANFIWVLCKRKRVSN